MIKKLEKFMNEKRYKHSDIAVTLRVRKRQVYRWLNGEAKPHRKNLKVIEEIVEGKILPIRFVRVKRHRARRKKLAFRFWQANRVRIISKK